MAGANAKENAEFDSQRKDAIEEASKTGSQKVFGAGSKDIKEAENPRRRRDQKSKQSSDDKAVPEAAGNGPGQLQVRASVLKCLKPSQRPRSLFF